MEIDDAERATPAARAVRETLDAVVAPLVREALITDALTLAGLVTLPASGAGMRDFASGPLRDVTTRALGVELAESVTDEILRTLPATPPPWSEPPGVIRNGGPRTRPSNPALRRSLSPAPSARRSTLAGPGSPAVRVAPAHAFHPVLTPVPLGTRRRIPLPSGGGSDAEGLLPWPAGMHSHIRGSTGTAPTDPEIGPPRSTAGPRAGVGASVAAPVVPLVLVATAETALYQTLTDWFDQRARVCRVDTPVELVRHIDAADGRRSIVILDGRCPSIRPSALAILLEEFPRLDVVLCRAAAATERIVLSASPSTARWLVYREPASLDHVAAECLRLVS